MKCNLCSSCNKDTVYNNRLYLYCALCKRVWKLVGKCPVELEDGYLDEFGMEAKKGVLDQISGKPL